MGSRLVCFITKEGESGICTHHYDGIGIEGDCKNCDFRTKFLGKEHKDFSFTHWLGDISENDKRTSDELIVEIFELEEEAKQLSHKIRDLGRRFLRLHNSEKTDV